MAWTRSASEKQRAEAAVTLAWAYRYIVDAAELHLDLELCIAALLDDPSPVVRRALAEAIADIPDAPRHIVRALADDGPEIASIVLAQTRALSETELAQYALTGEDCVQLALARRVDLPPAVAACLADKGGAEVAATLVKNLHVRLPDAVLRRLAERFGGDRMIRNAIFERPDASASIRCDLIEAAATASASLSAGSELGLARIEKTIRAATERSILRAASARPEQARELVRHLRAKGALTVALLARALISGERAFFEAAVAELSGLDTRQATALVGDPMGAGFAALLRRAGLPFYCLTPFRAALAALKETRLAGGGRALRSIAARVVDRCAAAATPEIAALLAFLRSLEKEAALEDARRAIEAIAAGLLETSAEESVPERLDAPREPELLERLNLIDMSPVETSTLPVALAS